MHYYIGLWWWHGHLSINPFFSLHVKQTSGENNPFNTNDFLWMFLFFLLLSCRLSTKSKTNCWKPVTNVASYKQHQLGEKTIIDQVTTMRATSKNVPFPGHNRLQPPVLITEHLIITLADARAIIKLSGHQYWWLAGGYDLEIGQFRSG